MRLIRSTLLAIALAVAAGAGSAQSELVVAIDVFGDHFDPHRPPGNAAMALMATFDGLTRQDADGNLQPALAESWEALSDTTWRFELRDDVAFHNGEHMDAEVVKQNIDRMMDPDEARAGYSFSVIDSYEVVDDYAIEVTTVAPDPLLPARMKSMYIAPASMLANPKSDDFNAGPVGTGPFEFVEWVQGERMVFEANEDYYLGASEVDRLVFRAVPEAASQVSEFLTGGVDIITNVQPEFISTIERTDGIGIETRVSPVNNFIILRTDVESPLQDKRVRQAMNYAVDVETITSTILGGYGHEYATVVHPFVFGFDESVEPFGFDPERARELLAEAGYGDGFSIDMDITPTVGGINNMEVAQAIVAQLGEVGIDVNLQTQEYGVMRERVYGNRTAAPMIRWAWKTWDNDPDGILYGLLHSESIGNFFADSYLDEAVIDARFNLDQEERAEIYSDLQHYMKEEATHLFLYYTDTIYGVSDRVEWTPRIDERLFFYEVSFNE